MDLYNGRQVITECVAQEDLNAFIDISEQIKTSLVTLNTLSRDLAAFLAELSPANDELEENDEDLQDGKKRSVQPDDDSS